MGRSLAKRAHWPNTASVTTSLHDSEAAGPGRCFSAKPCDWQKSSIITYSVVRKVSWSISELLFLVDWLDKLTVGYRIPFFQVLSISHQTFKLWSKGIPGAQ